MFKVLAAQQDRKLKDLVADLLRRGLAADAAATGTVRHRVRVPLVECVHDAARDEELTPERVAAVLLGEEAAGGAGPDRASVR
jgi:hypothetical protein